MCILHPRSVAAAASLLLVVGVLSPTAGAEPVSSPRETSIREVLERRTIEVPPRSRAFPLVADQAGCGSGGSRIVVDGDASDWVGEPTWINGTGRYDAGEYLWTDYPYDDAGTGQLVYPGEGDLLEPEEGAIGRVSPLLARYGASAADLVDVRFAADDEYLYLLAATNFLNAVDTTALGVGFDLDTDDTTGFEDWPLGARLRTGGLELFVTLHEGCGTVTSASGDVALDAVGGAVAVDTSNNTVEAAIPLDLLSGSRRPRVVAGAGVWEPGRGRWKQPIQGASGGVAPEAVRPGEPTDVRGGQTAEDPAIFDLAFLGGEPMDDPNNGGDVARTAFSGRAFQGLRQAEVLQTGTTGPSGVQLDLDRLSPDAPSDPLIRRPGDAEVFTRTYRSRLDLEGILFVDLDTGIGEIYLGRYQPYAVSLPRCVEGGCDTWPGERAPLFFFMHGGSSSHVNEFEERGDEVSAPFATARGGISVAPLGRGRRAPWYRGVGELDVLEVLDDVRHAYPVDPERMVIGGASLGGYATYQIGGLHPDLWAGAFANCPAVYEGATGARELGNEAPQTQNFTIEPLVPAFVNTPLVQVSGTVDPLVRIPSGHRIRDRALASGVALRYTEYLNGMHCQTVPARQTRWMGNHLREFLDLTDGPRPLAPARVRYVVDPRQFQAGPEVIGVHDVRDLGLGPVGAWWVDDVEPRPDVVDAAAALGPDVGGNTPFAPGEELVADVEAVSHALEGWRLDVGSCGDSVGFAGIEGGGNPQAAPDEGDVTGVPWPNPHRFRCQYQLRTGVLEEVLDLRVRNVESLTVDVRAAGLAQKGFELRASGDGELEVLLRGHHAGTAAGGCVVDATRTRRGLVVDLGLDGSICSVTVG